jgi:hypothetical protein
LRRPLESAVEVLQRRIREVDGLLDGLPHPCCKGDEFRDNGCSDRRRVRGLLVLAVTAELNNIRHAAQ